MWHSIANPQDRHEITFCRRRDGPHPSPPQTSTDRNRNNSSSIHRPDGRRRDGRTWRFLNVELQRYEHLPPLSPHLHLRLPLFLTATPCRATLHLPRHHFLRAGTRTRLFYCTSRCPTCASTCALCHLQTLLLPPADALCLRSHSACRSISSRCVKHAVTTLYRQAVGHSTPAYALLWNTRLACVGHSRHDVARQISSGRF